MTTTTTATTTDLYYWLIAPKAQGGGGRTVLCAELWLRGWDGATEPEGFRAWAQKSPSTEGRRVELRRARLGCGMP